jgi:hypothetical protein
VDIVFPPCAWGGGVVFPALRNRDYVRLPNAHEPAIDLANPTANGRPLNVFTGAVIAALVMLSITLTASVLLPDMGEKTFIALLGGGMPFTLAIAAVLLVVRHEDRRV